MDNHFLPWNTSTSTSKDPTSSAPNFKFVRLSSSNSFNSTTATNFHLYQILDPGGNFILFWNRVFLASCISALFVDPLYFYLPKVGTDGCMEIDEALFGSVLILRSLADLFYLLHIVLKFRTAFILPGSRVIGRGELVTDPKEIAVHYLKSDFIIDLAASLPLPQIMNIIPKLANNKAGHANNALSLIVLIQYVPRLFLIFPLNRRIIKSTGVVTKTAWAGAAYNLLLYLLASHVLGASWYLMSIQRQHDCWRMECDKENDLCSDYSFLDCNTVGRSSWLNTTHVIGNCDAMNEEIQFNFGIYAEALTIGVVSVGFFDKYLYCLWWGLKSLSSYGQDLATSRYIPETAFCILICIGGLVLFCHLIGNIQTYLQSMTVRLEEWRVKRRDTEEWMKHRQLPPDLQERVRRFVQYKWLATRGVDEDTILRALPVDLRRHIQRHLCLGLVLRVPFFAQMDSQLLDAICERLISSLSTAGTFVVREGDPVDEMLFIIRGQLESSTTNGGRSGFFNSIVLGPGDFCGEELLTWALMPNPSQNFPTSTRTVKSICEVEAFALRAEDLKYVANQFKRLHSKKLQHAFRYYSHQWRTWGSCFIQAAWRRFKKRKLVEELEKHESIYFNPDQDEPMEGDYVDTSEEMEEVYRDTRAELERNYEDSVVESSSMENTNNSQPFGVTVLASKFAANTRKGVHKKVKVIGPDEESSVQTSKLLKPDDPYVSTEGDID